MDWTNAARDFIDYGQTKKLVDLLQDELNPILKLTKGKNREASLTKAIGKGIEEFANTIKKNDLKNIVAFGKLTKMLEEYRASSPTEMKAFIPIVKKIESKTEAFKENDLGNVFEAARWCINHGMYQNAYSILLEGCISIVLELAGEEWLGQTVFIKYKRGIPNFVSQRKKNADKNSIEESIKKYNIDSDDEKKDPQLRSQIGLIIEKVWSIIPDEIALIFRQMNDYRNSFMHCGTGVNPLPDDLLKKLAVFIEQLEKWYLETRVKTDGR